MNDNFKNNRELFYDKMLPKMDWILDKLGIKEQNSIFRFDTSFNFQVECLKAALIKDRKNVNSIFKGDEWLCSEDDIYDVYVCLRPEDMFIRSGGSNLKGSISIDSKGSISSFKIRGLDFPMVCGNKTVVDPDGGAITIMELWMDINYAEKFFAFVKEKQSSSKYIHVSNYSGNNKSVKPISWDDVILSEDAKNMITKDLTMFLTNKEWFDKNRLPYRRGYLLYGLPGNGKTTVIRALLTQAGVPAFMLSNYSDRNSADAFERMFIDAANNERSMILLEDIDRIFCATGEDKDNDTNTISFSSFLNCLDGIASMDGVIVVATANNPKVLDSAILERPGRFDRVVGFPNPTPELALKYFMNLKPSFEEDKLKTQISYCRDMSFAQLKETYILAHQISLEENRDVYFGDIGVAANQLKRSIKNASSSSVGF